MEEKSEQKKTRRDHVPGRENIAVIVYKLHKSLRFDVTKTYMYHIHRK